MARVFISYRRVEPDMTVADALSKALEGMHEVFIDTKIPLGATWGNVIEESLSQADWMIALVSATSAASAMVVTEIRDRTSPECGARPSDSDPNSSG